ncbi:hypothetical protein ACFLYG_03920 [Chloroflexota bacterium]
MKAVANLLLRAEGKGDQKILETFVDSGIIAQLDNRNNQITFGRRGTGKTHVLRFLSGQLDAIPTNIVAFIDARTIGSTLQFSDPNIKLPKRCISLFRDIINTIYNTLLEAIVSGEYERSDEALTILYELDAHVNSPIPSFTEAVVEGRDKETNSNGFSAGVSYNLPFQATFDLRGRTNDTIETERKQAYRVDLEDKIIFPAISSSLHRLLSMLDLHLYILLDEWASIPPDIQPYLAEFIKRCILPVYEITIKIATLEYRSIFNINKDGVITGFELGSDLSANLDIDDYYVFDRNPDQITAIMADILFKHIKAEITDNYLEEHCEIISGDQLIAKLFTRRLAFRELARASEGVVRDFINIFIHSFFEAQRHGRDNIDQASIIEAARYWFETDKKHNLDDEMHKVLTKLIEDVIGARNARSFLVSRELEKHKLIQKLSDARILHLIRRGYSDKDNPGFRYNIYTLDYGTYVDLRNTSRQPEIDMPEESSDPPEDRIVPFDDKRSIRRIILTRDVLD